jgi:hypothetical protein
LDVALFPTPNFSQEIDDWWINAQRDFSWWVVWFEQYEKFLNHHANLASNFGAEALILGGSWVEPALPDGIFKDGSTSNVPEDAQARWLKLIEGIRQRFKGSIYWATALGVDIGKLPPFLSVLDGVYLVWSAPLASAKDVEFDVLQTEAVNILDNKVFPFQQEINKPVIIAAAYPSADGGITGCLPAADGMCLELSKLNPDNPDIHEIGLDLNEQMDVYNALLAAINGRDWVAGFVSEGYYPPVPLLDKSISIHGKPASGALWYWYPRMLGK